MLRRSQDMMEESGHEGANGAGAQDFTLLLEYICFSLNLGDRMQRVNIGGVKPSYNNCSR